ncbi:MAG TPA: response regulator [Chloroflexota bacterium]
MSGKILIVEDEPDVADLVADVLQMEGYSSHICTGETALDDALRFRPDLVLLDLMMPVVDGFEVARRLRANQQTHDLTIVVMTAMHDAASRAQEVGTPYFIAKPFDIAELLRIVNKAAPI